ncbi:MAG: hypothetical protein GX561_12035 [Lentisphaerae bacterium]|nr:hypothetical protein [Lentisphaerota bacterium]
MCYLIGLFDKLQYFQSEAMTKYARTIQNIKSQTQLNPSWLLGNFCNNLENRRNSPGSTRILLPMQEDCHEEAS